MLYATIFLLAADFATPHFSADLPKLLEKLGGMPMAGVNLREITAENYEECIRLTNFRY